MAFDFVDPQRSTHLMLMEFKKNNPLSQQQYNVLASRIDEKQHYPAQESHRDCEFLSRVTVSQSQFRSHQKKVKRDLAFLLFSSLLFFAELALCLNFYFQFVRG